MYCHFAVFSLSTTCNKCTCFCSSSSFCSNNLLKLHPHKQTNTKWHTVNLSNATSLLFRFRFALISDFACGKTMRNEYRRYYLASLIATIHALHSDSLEAFSSYCRWFSRRYDTEKQCCNRNSIQTKWINKMGKYNIDTPWWIWMGIIGQRWWELNRKINRSILLMLIDEVVFSSPRIWCKHTRRISAAHCCPCNLVRNINRNNDK